MAADRLATWYCAADVLLLTSRREGRPNVVLEALASGLQVLACDAGGTRELLVGLDGCLVDSRAPEQIAGALRERLAKPIDPALLRAHAEQFGWERGLEALEALLADALREPSRAQ
jgi:glycosyltransferase involved in cell wall biosynthesis